MSGTAETSSIHLLASSAWSVDLTLASIATALVACYYLSLFVLSRVRRGAPPEGRSRALPTVIVVVPAHNEELVIGPTIQRLLDCRYPKRRILVMNDGSSDRTSEIAHGFDQAHVTVVDRSRAEAGQGKGAVLNHAFQIIANELVRAEDAHDTIVAVMDADGRLDEDAIAMVAPYFADPDVGGVQICVRIENADQGLLQRAQDMEFVGFSGFVQTARDWTGSVGLGGNGQFTRLRALQSVGSTPWSDCLTEDLDLGLTLIENGWRIRFCPDAYVAQQGLDRVRPLLRQRTRWMQGHYQCWRHIPTLLRTREVPWRTKIDLTLYLGLLAMVVVFAATAAVGVLDLTGIADVENHMLDAFGGTLADRLVIVALSLGPPVCFIWTYQRRAERPFRWWQVPAATAGFTAYTYLFVVSQVWAWVRLASRRNNWAKTQRVAIEP